MSIIDRFFRGYDLTLCQKWMVNQTLEGASRPAAKAVHAALAKIAQADGNPEMNAAEWREAKPLLKLATRQMDWSERIGRQASAAASRLRKHYRAAKQLVNLPRLVDRTSPRCHRAEVFAPALIEIYDMLSNLRTDLLSDGIKGEVAGELARLAAAWSGKHTFIIPYEYTGHVNAVSGGWVSDHRNLHERDRVAGAICELTGSVMQRFSDDPPPCASVKVDYVGKSDYTRLTVTC